MLSLTYRFRLLTQIAIVSSMLLVIVIFIATAVNIHHQQKALSRDLLNHGLALGRSLTSTLNYLIVSENYDVLEETLLKSVEFPEIISLKVTNANGDVLGHVEKSKRNEVRLLFAEKPERLPAQLQYREQPLSTLGQDRLTIWYPVKTSSVLGWLNMVISLESIVERRSSIIVENIIGAIIAVIVDVVCLMIVLIGPIRDIRRVIGVAQGLDSARPTLVDGEASSYEIEQLFVALNGAGKRLTAQKEEIEAQTNVLKSNNSLLDGIARTQSMLMSDKSREQAFFQVTKAILDVADCHVAMICECLDDALDGTYLNILAISHFELSEADSLLVLNTNTRHIKLDESAETIKQVVLGRKRVVSVSTAHDPLQNRENDWLCDINAFMGIPLLHQGSMVGVLLLGNGSAESHRTKLEGYFSALSHLIINSREHLQALEIFERNKLILESTNEGIYGLDINGCVTFVNSAACGILGYREQEIVNADIHSLIHHSYSDGSPYPKEEWPITKVMLTAQSQRVLNEVFWHKGGQSIPVAYTCAPLRQGGEFVGAVVTFIDLTELQHAEDALRMSQERFDRAVNGTNDGLWECDLKKTELWCSARFNMLLGDGEEIKLLPIRQFLQRVHPAERALITTLMAPETTRVGYFDEVCRIMSHHESYVWFRVRGSVYKEVDGTPVRVSGSIMDISEQVRVDTMKQDFISTVSHELRTPLTSIRGSLSLINGGVVGDVDKKIVPMLDIAYRNTDRLLGIINDILDMAKLEAGKVKFNIEEVDLVPFVKENVELSQGLANQHNIILSVSTELIDGWVDTDEGRLNQVMNNLLSNAIKFSEKNGKVDVHLSQNQSYYRLSVVDNGAGIHKDYQPFLFKKFTQEQESQTRNVGGSGLGLAITKELVEQLGGVLSYETTFGEGTTFFIDLPRRHSGERHCLIS